VEKQKKRLVVEVLAESFDKAQAVFITDFKGLPMETMIVLRRRIKQSGGELKVTKNTLVKLAAKGRPSERLGDLLVGNNALSFTQEDPAALAKVLQDFAKEQEKFKIKGGLLKDRLIDPAQVKALATLPPRDSLLSSLLGTMQAVPTGLVRALAGVPRKLLYALVAVRDQKAQEA
jgi:large subunit ribosomal protein L10